jgi:molybdopterin molybdotransferase
VASLSHAAACDLILTSGGASVGDFDHVKGVVGAHGDLGFWRVRVRPGKPLLFGTVFGSPIIGLPGNPTSAMVTFELFARPAIRAMSGASLHRPTIRAISDERIDNRGGRRSFIRVRLRFDGTAFHATTSGPQDSAMILPLAWADGLLVVSENIETLEVGEWADVIVWRLPA